MKNDGIAAMRSDPGEGERTKSINPELWHACAGPLVSLPAVGSLVVYFPQGHSEQIAASMCKGSDAHIPSYPNLPSKLICLLHNVTLHADAETDEVYAQMTLQPVSTYDREALLASDLALMPNKPQTEFFCKTLTQSDTSTHGGFSVPRRAAEKIFPPLDYTMAPPAQELVARDLHDSSWTFRHIYRGQPKRHLLTTGWSLFVSSKKLLAGDSVLFIRDFKSQLLLGIRRAHRQPTNISSSVLSSDSMHIGIIAAAAHAAANNSPFTVFYNPRASPSGFVISLAKYNKAVYSNQLSLGMRFRMMFETEESGTRRYVGTITGISDIDPVRWKNSQWRNLQVAWDESAAGERRTRVSIWEIEPVAAPFFICPPFFGSKRPCPLGIPDDESDMENLLKRAMPCLGDDICMKDSQQSTVPGTSLVRWMSMQQNSQPSNMAVQHDYHPPLSSAVSPVLQGLVNTNDISRQLSLQSQILQQNNFQISPAKLQPLQHLDQLPKLPATTSQLGFINQPRPQQQHHISEQSQQPQPKQQISANRTFNQNPTQVQILQSKVLPQSHLQQEQSLPLQMHQGTSLLQNQQQQPQIQQYAGVWQPQNKIQVPTSLLQNGQNSHQPDLQLQLQLLQKIQQQQQQSLLLQSSIKQSQMHEQKRVLPLEASQQLSRARLTPHQSNQQVIQVQDQQQDTAKNPSTGSQILQTLQKHIQHKIQQQPVLQADLTWLPLPNPSNLMLTSTNGLMVNGIPSVVTDRPPSCSTSPSTNNSPLLNQAAPNRSGRSVGSVEERIPSFAIVLNPSVFDAMGNQTHIAQELPKDELKPSIMPITKPQIQHPHMYQSPTQIDHLDSSSSGTSVCISQTGGSLQQNFAPSAYNSSSFMFREVQNGMQPDPRNGVVFGDHIDDQLGIPMPADPMLQGSLDTGKSFQNQVPTVDILNHFDNPKEMQADLSSSIVAQSYEIPSMALNPVAAADSSINNRSFLNSNPWVQPQHHRMRTFTKVYKRGAVGRSIDVTRYKGYEELQHDLARMFGIEGQLEDAQRTGWKLVYVDHENDVLLVGDDPWEEFVNCVRCIKILSPAEVQQMSLDGDVTNNVLQNQACSSSDGGHAWRGQCDQNSGSFGH